MIIKSLQKWCVHLLPAISLIVSSLPVTAVESLDFSLTVTSPNNTPEAAVSTVLKSICPDILLNENTVSNLGQICAYSAEATPEEKAIVSEELSAKPNTVTNTLTSKTPSMSNARDIGIRLSALRNSAKRSTQNGFRAKLQNQTLSTPVLNARSDNEAGSLFSQRLSGFVNVNSISAEQLETQTEMGYDSTSQGLLFGVDYRLRNSTFVGVAAQYYQTSAELTDIGSELDASQMGFTLYGTHFINEQWYVESTLNNSQQQLDLKRDIDLVLGQETLHATAAGDTSSQQWGAYLGTGFDIPLKYGVNSVASMGVSYLSTNISAYTETNAGNLGLEIDSQDIASLTSYANVYLSKVFSTSFGVVIPQLSATWVHETKTEKETITAEFVNDDSNTKFVFNTPQPDPNYFILGLDMQMVLPQGRMVYFKYSNVRQLRDKSEFALAVGFRLEF